MRLVSKRMVAQKRQERVLTLRLLERCGGVCEGWGMRPDFRGLSKHEKVFRSHGGDPLDENNTELLCGRCHSLKHGVIEV
jgi:hypothetical protein